MIKVRKLALAGRVTLIAKVDGEDVLRGGQTVQLCHGDTVLASGKLEAD